MRNRQTYLLIAILVLASAGVLTAYADFFHNVYAESIAKDSVPSYADKCAHGHNGFNCNTAQYKIDIKELQIQERDLRSDITTLGSKITHLEEKLSIVDNALAKRISILEEKH